MKKFILLFILVLSICSKQAFAQPANDDCTTAQAIGTLPTPAACPSGAGAAINIAGTITGATEGNPYIYQNTCSGAGGPNMGVPAFDVWYTFVASSYHAIITVNSTFANPNIAMYAGNCANLGGGVGGCAVGAGGTVTLNVEQMVIGTTYYIQVSGNPGQTGTFNMSIQNNQGCSDCIVSTNLSVSPLPVNGMYNPGQTVHFCYHISQYAEINTNWLHGVQVSLGSGWNAASLVPSPVTPYDCGTWTYYPGGITDPGGTAWPAGFYFNRTCAPLGGGTAADGIPGNNYGDHITANAAGNQNTWPIPGGIWNFCFDVTVAAGCSPGSNLSVTFNTSGDGESGPWTSAGCATDPPTPFNAIGACCQPTTSSVAATCAGNDGQATATPVGAAGPYDYSWTNSVGAVVSTTTGAAGANTATGLAAGTYTVSITNALNCLTTNTVTVGGTPGPTTPTAGSNSPVCIGNNLNLTAANVAGATYAWLGPNSYSSAIQNPTIGSVTALAAGTYTVTATGATGCTVSSTVTVVINPPPTVTVPANSTVCNGTSIAATNFTSTPAGATYAWTNSNTAIGLGANGTGNIAAFNATNTGTTSITATITVTPTLAGCPGVPSNYTITVDPTPTVVVPANIVVCNGGNVAATNFTSPVAGATFDWTNSNTTIGLGANGTGNITAFTATNTGTAPITATITVTPTANGCPGTPSNYTIIVNPTPTVVVPANIAVCDGGNIAATNFTSPTAGATFAWTNSNTTIGLGANGIGNIATFNGINTGATSINGTITVTPTANTCPGTPSTYTITVNPTPTVVVPANSTVCDGDNIPATNFTSPVAGATYTWTNSNTNIGLAANGIGDIAAFTATNTTIAAITATITVTPTAGCAGTPSTYTIIVNPSPTVVVPANIAVCDGTTIPTTNFTSPVAGATFDWTNTNTAIGLAANGIGNVPAFNATNATASAISGTITVTPTANGCIGTPSNYMITVNSNVPANAGIDDTICFGGSTVLNATPNGAGYSFAWTPATGLAPTNTFNPTANPATTTVYTVVITDASGCTGTDSVTIYSDPMITINKTEFDVNCNGACDGQAIVIPVGGAGGYQYLWSNTATTASINGLCPGSYTVTVTDAWGCTATADTTVSEPTAVVASITASTPTSCNAVCDGTANSSAIGGTPGAAGYSYSWNSIPAQNTANATSLCAGPFVITVTDSKGCIDTAHVTITEPSPVVVPPIPLQTICIGSNAIITAFPSGGNGGYHYNWLPAGTAGDTATIVVNPIVTTTYTLNVTDANGCTSPAVIDTVNVNPPLSVIAAGTTSICPGTTTPISAVANGGNGGPYTYNWGPIGTGSGTPLNVSPATTTTYTVMVTDNCGTPPAFDSVIITILPLPVIDFGANILSGCTPLCVNFTDSSSISGGAIVSWDWNFGGAGNANTQNPNTCFLNNQLLVTQQYTITLTATSAAGCSTTDSIVNMITVYPTPDAQFNTSPNPTTILNSVVNFTDQSSADVNYWDWSFGDGTGVSSTTQNPVHTYPNGEGANYWATLFVQNNYGCMDTVSHIVEILPEFTFFIPNAFTPNGDGINDYFNGTGIGIIEYEMYIFDRWGNMIYYTDSLLKPWDGKANHGDEMAQQDVYVWKVRLTDVFNKKHNYIGTVTIVK